MKKNKTMRLASVLLVMVLLSTCVIGGTFAKYTRQINNQDSARVARWGFGGENEHIAITNLFMNAYGDTVKGTGDANVIAPGTGNTATFQFIFTDELGTAEAPEVAYTISVDAGEDTCPDAIAGNGSIKWAVVQGEVTDFTTIDTKEWGSWEDMIAEIESLDGSATGEQEYAPGSELPPVSANPYTVAWKWDFDGNDAGDTVMGNEKNLAEVVLKITITATQKD